MRRAYRHGKRRCGQRVGDVMAPRQRQQHINAAGWGLQSKFGPVRSHMNVGCREVAIGGVRREAPGFTIANDALPVQPVIIVGVHNRDAVERQAGVNFALRFRHAFQGTKTFQVRGGQVIH